MQKETKNTEQFVEQVERNDASLQTEMTKKPFVEPSVSIPVDVLEATTFFQATDTGVA